MISLSQLAVRNSHSNFLCSDQLSQEIIVGPNFAHAFHIGTTWSAEDVMSLTYNGKHLVDVLPSKDINALVYCAERVAIPPYSNAQVVCSVPRLRQKAHLGKMFLFEPTHRHKSRYAHCDTYEGVVTTEDQMTRSGSFNIIMTNNSARHTMIHAHETIGMLKSIDNTQVCTIHKSDFS